MKRARLLLSAVAVIAVVGTTLAFKASKERFVLWTASSPDQCKKVEGIKTTAPNQGQFTAYYTTTGPATGVTTCNITTSLLFVED